MARGEIDPSSDRNCLQTLSRWFSRNKSKREEMGRQNSNHLLCLSVATKIESVGRHVTNDCGRKTLIDPVQSILSRNLPPSQSEREIREREPKRNPIIIKGDRREIREMQHGKHSDRWEERVVSVTLFSADQPVIQQKLWRIRQTTRKERLLIATCSLPVSTSQTNYQSQIPVKSGRGIDRGKGL